MPELITEVAQFRGWADSAYPGQRFGDWECDYPNWDRLYEAVLDFIGDRQIEHWTTDETTAVLYALARDNEAEFLRKEIGERDPSTLLELAKASIRFGERDAKWQLAAELGELGSLTEEIETCLIETASDADEYVRRRSLSALARLGSFVVEDLATIEWNRSDENQEYSRINVLWSLHRIRSPSLEQRLQEAERDSRPYLSEYAERIRRGRLQD